MAPDVFISRVHHHYWNISHTPAVKPKIKLVARLDLDPIHLFLDGHDIWSPILNRSSFEKPKDL